MKRKTEYFLSSMKNANSANRFKSALDEVIAQREEFILSNEDDIEEIVDEKIEYKTFNQSDHYSFIVIMTFCYYQK